MNWGGWWRSGLVLAMYAVVVLVAVGTVWPRYHVGESVPVGLAAGALVLASRAARWVCVPVVAVASTLAYSAAGADPGVAVVWGLALTAGATTTGLLLTRRTQPGHRPDLRSIDDYRAFLAATLLGAAVSTAVLTVAGSAMLGHDLLLMAVGTFLAHLSSYLVVLPFFMVAAPHPGWWTAGVGCSPGVPCW